MENFIFASNIILAVILVVVILLQKSEGGALGIGASQESFITSRSAGNILTKATAIIATLFIITSISLTIMAKKKYQLRQFWKKLRKSKTLLNLKFLNQIDNLTLFFFFNAL